MNRTITAIGATLLFTGFFSFTGTLQAQSAPGAQSIPITHTVGQATESAYLYLPNDYSTSTNTYPLLVFLHGMGEGACAGGLPALYNHGDAGGPPYFIERGQWPSSFTNPANGQTYKFIVLAPQYPCQWSYNGRQLTTILNNFIPNYRVDTSRIYVTGLSAGGIGTIEFAVHEGLPEPTYPAAAIVPMSPASIYPPTIWGQTIVNESIDTWAIGSDPADTFGIRARELVSVINSISPGFARFSNYPQGNPQGHCCWNTYYNPTYRESINGVQMNIYEWMLQHTRIGITPPPINLFPTANAGADQSITLPTNTITLSGSGSDSDGTIVSYAWTKVSGGSATIVSSNAATTVVNDLAQGTYRFRLTVTDDDGATASDEVVVNVVTQAGVLAPYTGTPKNIPGTIQVEEYDNGGEGVAYYDNAQGNVAAGSGYRVNEGVDIEVTADTNGEYNLGWTEAGEWTKYSVQVSTTGTYTLNARVASLLSDKSFRVELDGTTIATVTIPNTGGWQQWQTVSIPTITLTAGAHTIRVYNITDGFNLNWISFETMTVSPINQSPTANAGTDQTITLPTTTATLSGSGTDTDGSVISYNWSQMSGPTATIGTATSASTATTFTSAGTYIFQLTVTDNLGAIGTDTVTITINPAADPTPSGSGGGGGSSSSSSSRGTNRPIANAGSDIIIALPTTSVTLRGTGTYTDGSVSYYWTKQSGKSGARITTAANATTTITNLQLGTYVFRLEVTDSDGKRATDEVTVQVVSVGTVIPATASVAGATTSAQIQTTATILNVRKKPSAMGTLLGKVSKGSTGEIVATASGWTQVKFTTGLVGWVSNVYINNTTTPQSITKENSQIKTTATTLNVRKTPAGAIVGKVPFGTTGTVQSSQGSWTEILFSTVLRGFVSNSYIKAI